jgi:hypothetical protein
MVVPDRDTQKGGDGIEEATGAAGPGAVDAAGNHGSEESSFVRIRKESTGGWLVHEGVAKGGIEEAKRGPARIACGGITTGESHGFETAQSAIVTVFDAKEFPAPDGVVGSKTRAIADDCQGGAGEGMFGEDGGGVRMMVLDGDETGVVACGEVVGGAGAHVGGMEIVGDEIDANIEKPHEVGDGLVEVLEGTRVAEVAEVLADDDVALAQDGDGVLEFAAEA